MENIIIQVEGYGPFQNYTSLCQGNDDDTSYPYF